MVRPSLTTMVADYGETKDPVLLDQIIDLACRLTPESMPHRLKSDADLSQMVNLRLVKRIRKNDLLSRVACSHDFRKFIGRVAINLCIDAQRRVRTWEKAVPQLRILFENRQSDRQHMAKIQETLAEIRSQLTDSSHIQVFDLLREGRTTREISERLGRGFSEQSVWLMKSKIRKAVERRFGN